MRLFSSYSVKIKHYNHIFQETVNLYRNAVDFLIEVCLNEWDTIVNIHPERLRLTYVEHLCHLGRTHTNVAYPEFDRKFYKFPSYLRRSAINEAIGKVSSYRGNLANWRGKILRPGAGNLPFREPDMLILPCTGRSCMNRLEITK